MLPTGRFSGGASSSPAIDHRRTASPTHICADDPSAASKREVCNRNPAVLTANRALEYTPRVRRVEHLAHNELHEKVAPRAGGHPSVA
jgi:hypothetical protein